MLCPECGKSRYSRNNKQCHACEVRIWRLKNPEKSKQASKRYREANPEKYRKASLDWKNRNIEKVRKQQKIRAKKWRQKNPKDYLRISRLANIRRRCKEHGITLLDYYAGRSTGCQICRHDFSENTMCLDHNHETGKFRGFLCKKCNFMLGNSRDNIAILEKAIRYLI